MAIPDRKYITNETGSVPGTVGAFSDPTCNPEGSNRPTDYQDITYTEMKRQRIKPAKLLPTPATYVEDVSGLSRVYPCDVNIVPGSYYRGMGGHNAAHFGEAATFPKSYSPSTSAINQARLTAFNRLNAESTQLGETLATFSQTTRMVTKRAFQVGEIALALKRGDFKKLSSMLKGDVPGSVKRLSPSRRLADGWLELEFGWKPLLSDVHLAVEMYRNGIVEGQIANSRANVTKGGFGPKGQSYKGNADRIAKNGANASIKLYATVSNPTLATLNQLGLINPASIGWQLLPFSFVVDWFLPVSKALSSMTASVGYDVTMECRVSESATLTFYRYCGEPQIYRRTVRRTIHSNPVVPKPEVRLDLKAKSMWHLNTALALLRQRFGR